MEQTFSAAKLQTMRTYIARGKWWNLWLVFILWTSRLVSNCPTYCLYGCVRMCTCVYVYICVWKPNGRHRKTLNGIRPKRITLNGKHIWGVPVGSSKRTYLYILPQVVILPIHHKFHLSCFCFEGILAFEIKGFFFENWHKKYSSIVFNFFFFLNK